MPKRGVKRTKTVTRDICKYRGVNQAELYQIVSTASAVGNYWFKSKAYDFRLSDLPNFNDLTEVFDFYRIKKAVLLFTPVNGPDYGDGMMSGSGSTGIPRSNVELITSIDTDDVGIPADPPNNVYSHKTCKVHQFNKPIRIVVYPRAYTDANQQQEASQLPKNSWFKTTQTNIDFFGVKVFIRVPTSNAVGDTAWFRYNVYTEIHLELKGVKTTQ